MLELLLITVLMGIVVVWLYNAMIRDRNQVLSAWSDIDVQLKRRHDLVPQLVTVVKAYADHEKATLAAVTELRTRSEAAAHLPLKAAVEAEIDSAVHRLIAVAEAYPDLKANAGFLQLQSDLVGIEDHIQYARRFYNGAVRIYNTGIQRFPQLLLAHLVGFRAAEYFEVEAAGQRDAAKVAL